MKFIRLFTLLIMTSVCCFAASTKNQLIGSWMNVWPGIGKAILQFKDDGSFSATISFEDGKVYLKGGTWKLENKKIIYEYRDEKGSVTQNDTDEILSLTDESFTILARDGGKRTYKKLKK